MWTWASLLNVDNIWVKGVAHKGLNKNELLEELDPESEGGGRPCKYYTNNWGGIRQFFRMTTFWLKVWNLVHFILPMTKVDQ